MLALTRRIGQRIQLTIPGIPPTFIKVVSVHGDKVRFGFDADRAVQIDREEVVKAREAGPGNQPTDFM